MIEAVNDYYLEDGNIDSVKNFIQCDKKEEIIYEVIRIISGIPLFLDEHIERMKLSFESVGKEFYYTNDKVEEYIKVVVEKNKITEGNIKITFNTEDDTLKVFFIKHNYPSNDMYEKGVKGIIFKGERENPNAKIVKKDFRECINKELKEKNAYEALLEDNEGYITEGSRSNIFYIKDNVIITSPNHKVLKGITRNKILNIAKDKNLRIEEKLLSKEQIFNMDSIFLSGTSPKVLGFSEIENKKFKVDNLILKEIAKEYDKIIENYIENRF